MSQRKRKTAPVKVTTADGTVRMVKAKTFKKPQRKGRNGPLNVGRREQLRELGFDSYGAYLRSKHWRGLREDYRSTYGWKCVCGATERLHLHHVSYDRLGSERLTDVVPLCQPCHEVMHELRRAGYALDPALVLSRRAGTERHR